MADISKIQVPESATQYNIKDAQARRDIEGVKADLGDQTGLYHWNERGLIDLSGSSVNLTPETNQGIDYAVIDCSAGDKFIITATGGNKSRVWGFIDGNNAILTVSDANATVENFEITAPTNAVKLILNAYRNSDMYAYKVGNNLAYRINTLEKGGLTDEVKEAILACFRNVPWIDGDSCYANLEAVFGVVRYEWTYPSQNVIMLHAGANPNMNDVLSRAVLTDSEYRRTIVYTYGEAPYYYNGEASNYYPIPVPADATKVKVEMSPSNEYVYMHTVRLNGSAYGDSIVDNRVTWTQLTNGVLEKTITNPGNLFLMLNIKHVNSNSAFPSEPSRVKITFIKGE
jgi:hypothetical protein